MTEQPYAQMIDLKRWADRGLCETIQESASRLGDAMSQLRLILDHIHTVDRIFQHHLQGRPHGYPAARSETLPTLDALVGGLGEVGAWYATHVRTLSATDLQQPVDFAFTSGKPARMKRGEILLHVCLHGTYHRGNAGALLQLNGVTPSRDAVTDFLEAAAASAGSPGEVQVRTSLRP